VIVTPDPNVISNPEKAPVAPVDAPIDSVPCGANRIADTAPPVPIENAGVDPESYPATLITSCPAGADPGDEIETELPAWKVPATDTVAVPETPARCAWAAIVTLEHV
jgi:hypothetical protein